MNTEANAGGQEIGAEVSPGTTKSGSIDLNDFKVPTGGILKILDDAFGKKLPILQGQLTDFDREGELLGTISSDLAKRFLTASVQFAIAATSTDDKLSIVSAYSAACSRILGYLGWRVVGTDIPGCAGKTLVLGGDWNVYAVSSGPVRAGIPFLVDYTPAEGSLAAEYMRKLSAILAGHGGSLKLPAAPQQPLVEGEKVIATISDPRFKYILDLSYALTLEYSALQDTSNADRQDDYYGALITYASFIIDAAVYEVFPEGHILDWELRNGGVIVEADYESPIEQPGSFSQN
jgi:hypothetical protein